MLRPMTQLIAGASGETKVKTFKLSCDHEFHENCVQGWCIVGKKDLCPFCCEKIDMKLLISESGWNLKRMSILWTSLLSVLQWFIVWIPIVVFASMRLLRVFHFADFRRSVDTNSTNDSAGLISDP